MKKPIRLLAAAVFIALGAARLAAEDDPFWASEKYTPAGTRIESIPVADLDKSWDRATLLTPALLSADAKAYMKEFANEPSVKNASFDVAGDFNRDGRPDRGVVGVYRTKSGRTGRFVLILTKAGAGWTKAFVDTVPGDPGFGILMLEDGRLLWTTCFECDAVSEISWEKDHYETDESGEEEPEE